MPDHKKTSDSKAQQQEEEIDLGAPDAINKFSVLAGGDPVKAAALYRKAWERKLKDKNGEHEPAPEYNRDHYAQVYEFNQLTGEKYAAPPPEGVDAEGVKQFQTEHSLKADGKVRPETVNAARGKRPRDAWKIDSSEGEHHHHKKH